MSGTNQLARREALSEALGGTYLPSPPVHYIVPKYLHTYSTPNKYRSFIPFLPGDAPVAEAPSCYLRIGEL